MLDQLLNVLKIAGLLLAFTAIWLLTIAAVFRDLQRRSLHGMEQFLWLAVTTLLPIVGFLIYWVARWLTRLLLPEQRPAEDPRLRMTMAQPVNRPAPPANSPAPPANHAPEPQRRLPTVPGLPENQPRRDNPASTMPADAWQKLAAGMPAANNPPAAGRLSLVALEGPYMGSRFPLEQFPARIGRGSAAALALNSDQGISRQHAELYVDASGRVCIRDLNSTHGTFVNGQRVVDAPLNLGDRVNVGVSAFLFTNQ